MPSLVLSVQPGREPYRVPGTLAGTLTSPGMNKVPEITFAFWVMKICATTLGETAGDLLSMTLNVGYAVSSLILIRRSLSRSSRSSDRGRFTPSSIGA